MPLRPGGPSQNAQHHRDRDEERVNGDLHADSAAAATPDEPEDTVIEFDIGHVDFIIEGPCQAYVKGDNGKLFIKDPDCAIYIHLDTSIADILDFGMADDVSFKVREEGNRIIVEHHMAHIVNVHEENGRLIIQRRVRDANSHLMWHRRRAQ